MIKKKKNVGWNGKQTEIPLMEVTSDQVRRLFTAESQAQSQRYVQSAKFDVSFGSKDNGESLQIEVEACEVGHPGGSGLPAAVVER